MTRLNNPRRFGYGMIHSIPLTNRLGGEKSCGPNYYNRGMPWTLYFPYCDIL